MNKVIRLLCFSVLMVWVAVLIAHVGQSQIYAETADTRLAVADADVRSGKATEAFGNDRGLRVGYDSGTGDLEMHSLIKFNLADLQAGGVVNSAQLSLYLAGTTSGDNPMQITAFRILSNWGEDVTWNSHSALAIDLNHSTVTSVDAVLGWHTWNLTPMLQAWVNDSNRGSELAIMLRGHLGPDSRRRAFWSKDCADNDFQGNRPKLDVQFAAPTATPTATATNTATPTFTPTATATPTPTATSTPAPSAGVSISVEPVFSHTEPMTLPTGSLITYTVSIHNITGTLSNVQLRADAEIATGGIPLAYVLVKDENVSDGGKVLNHKVAWDFTTLQPGDEASYTYTIGSPPSSGRTLYFPSQYLLNEGATLTWDYPEGSGEARTRPLRNPPFYELQLPIIQTYAQPHKLSLPEIRK